MSDTLHYQSGFGNEFATEAVAGALPQGRNSPQRAPHGLYAELLSGTAFTAPRALNRRTWMYRRQPSVVSGAYAPYAQPLWTSGAAGGVDMPPDPLRWQPFPIPDAPLDFVDGMRTVVANGDVQAQSGVAALVYTANRSMSGRAFVNADGEMLLVPQQGRLQLVTELGRLDVAPGEIALLPRGLAFRVGLPDGPSRGYVCENYGTFFRLPELGPIGSNGLANARDFLAPVAAFEEASGPVEMIRKFGGRLWRNTQPATPFNVAAWHGNLAPQKYDTARFMTIGTVSFDHPDPSIFTVLTSPSDTAGTANADFVISAALDGGRRHLPPALVPPQRDERIHGVGARPVRRQARGLQARRRQPAQQHGAARPRRRGVRARQHRHARAAQARPHAGVHVREPLALRAHRVRDERRRARRPLRQLLERAARSVSRLRPSGIGRGGCRSSITVVMYRHAHCPIEGHRPGPDLGAGRSPQDTRRRTGFRSGMGPTG